MAATSVGIVHGYLMLDLCYDEDCNAAVDFNVVMTSKGEFVEVQGTAEGKPFTKETIDSPAGSGREGHQAALRGSAGCPADSIKSR